MISKSCKYAIRATVFIASKAREKIKVSVKEIAEEIEAPEAFTGKILQILNKNKIVTSLKGPYGGFYSNEDQLDLPILDVVKAIDGLGVFTNCVFGLHKCSDDHPCPMHFEYSKTRDQMHASFKNTTIRSLADNLSKGIAFLKNPEL
ncbi:MAG: RrF2 family transcriptional regulator [Aequorivita sp.]